DVGAIGIAEIDDPPLAVVVGPAVHFSVSAGQREGTADGGAVERRGVQRGLAVAGGQSQRGGKGDQSSGERHGAALHALLIGLPQGGGKGSPDTTTTRHDDER